MKNLANCKPSEFLIQTNKIRKSVSKWLTDTDIVNIRKRIPSLPNDASSEDRDKAYNEQVNKNINAIMDAVMEDYPQETLEILALMCFVEPEDIDSHSVKEYLASFSEMIGAQEVVDFFMSLMTWVNRLT